MASGEGVKRAKEHITAAFEESRRQHVAKPADKTKQISREMRTQIVYAEALRAVAKMPVIRRHREPHDYYIDEVNLEDCLDRRGRIRPRAIGKLFDECLRVLGFEQTERTTLMLEASDSKTPWYRKVF